MSLARLQRSGHTPIALVGGGTGLIGDPSGKSAGAPAADLRAGGGERAGHSHVSSSGFSISGDAATPPRMANNVDWLRPIGFLDFLRDVGKHFTVNYMMAKESVKRRLVAEEGISFTEFSYQLLQAYDYLVLHDRFTCNLQMGGSDQWGNITAGIDSIRKVRGAQRARAGHARCSQQPPGTKFGKTEAGAVWLDAEQTSPFRFYQFWLNTDDRDVVQVPEVLHVAGPADDRGARARGCRGARAARGAASLAREVTRWSTAARGIARAPSVRRRCSSAAPSADATAEEILTVFDDVPSVEVSARCIAGRACQRRNCS